MMVGMYDAQGSLLGIRRGATANGAANWTDHVTSEEAVVWPLAVLIILVVLLTISIILNIVWGVKLYVPTPASASTPHASPTSSPLPAAKDGLSGGGHAEHRELSETAVDRLYRFEPRT